VIPLSVLALDHPEPLAGWEQSLAESGVELLEDELYRPAIRREDARTLIRERRQQERDQADQAAQRAAAHKVVLPSGVPVVEGSTPFESLVAADGVVTPQQEFGRRGSRSVFEELLDQELAEGQRKAAEERAEAAKKARNG
jgi:hypothetical protein